MDGLGRRQTLTDSQLDRELEGALGVDPSPDFLARVRTRIATEAAPSSWRLAVAFAFRRISVEPMAAFAIVGIVLTLVVPQMMRPSPSSTQIARMSGGLVPVPVTPDGTDDPVPSRQHRVSRQGRTQAQPSKAERPAFPGDARARSFEDRILLAPADREAFDRLLAVVNDHTIELVAPVLESTHAAADVVDAVVNAPALVRPEGVSQ